MFQRRVALLSVSAMASLSVLAVGTPAGASSPVIKVTPAQGLTNGAIVTVTGKSLPKTTNGSTSTWFADECNGAVHGTLNPAKDTKHCATGLAHLIPVSKNGTFTIHYQVASGKVGDGSCGVPKHLTCVIGIGTAKGQGTVVKIAFKNVAPPATTTTTTIKTTTTTIKK